MALVITLLTFELFVLVPRSVKIGNLSYGSGAWINSGHRGG